MSVMFSYLRLWVNGTHETSPSLFRALLLHTKRLGQVGQGIAVEGQPCLAEIPQGFPVNRPALTLGSLTLAKAY
jgi:hypothetical protein